jgi:hypothetical protein
MKSKSQLRREAIMKADPLDIKQDETVEKKTEKIQAGKEISGRIAVQKIIYYKGCQIYIRKYDHELFQYDLIFDNQLYSDYIVAEIPEGQKELTEGQIVNAVGVMFTSACVTIDTLIDMHKEALARQPLNIKKTKNGNAVVN